MKKIAHITDVHLDESFPFNNKTSARKRFDNILESIQNQDIEHVVCTGDIGENEGIQYFFEQLKTMNLSIALGNHDNFTNISKYFHLETDDPSNKLYRSELQNNFKLIYLDSSAGYIDPNQLAWLKKELTSFNPIIIFIHHPILGLPLKVDAIGKLNNREDLVKLLEAVPNQVTIYCGHYHLESSLTHKNIQQCITPAVAFQIEKRPSEININTAISGYRIIQMEENQLSSEVILLKNAD